MSKEIIPTAEEHFSEYFKKSGYTNQSDLIQWGIEFTKLHIVACKEEIYNKGLDGLVKWGGNPYTGEGSDYLDKDSIMNTYPLEKIK